MPLRILIADDEIYIREGLHEALQRPGRTVDIVAGSRHRRTRRPGNSVAQGTSIMQLTPIHLVKPLPGTIVRAPQPGLRNLGSAIWALVILV